MRRHLTALLAAATCLMGSAAAQLPAPPGGTVKRTEKAAVPDARTEKRSKRPVAPMRDAWLRFKRNRSDSDDHPRTTGRSRGSGEGRLGGSDQPERIREHIRERASDHSSGRESNPRQRDHRVNQRQSHPRAKTDAAPAARRSKTGSKTQRAKPPRAKSRRPGR